MIRKLVWIFFVVTLFVKPAFADEFQAIPAEVAPQYHFDLGKIFYSNEKGFDKDLGEETKIADEVQTYRGKVTGSGKGLLDLIYKLEQLNLRTQKLYVYRYLSYAINTTLEPQLSATDQALSGINSKISFVDTELLQFS